MGMFIIGILVGWAVFQILLTILGVTNVIDFDIDENKLMYWILFPVPLLLAFLITRPISALCMITIKGYRYLWNYNSDGKFWRWFDKDESKKVLEMREKNKADYLAKTEKEKVGKFIVYKEDYDDRTPKVLDYSEPLDYEVAKKLFYKRVKEEKYKMYSEHDTYMSAEEPNAGCDCYYICMDTLDSFNKDFPKEER